MEPEQTNALATVGPTETAIVDARLAQMTEQQIDQLIRTVDKVADARQRIIQACLRRAEPDDFINFDGKPYLEGEGAQRVAATVGIQIGRPEVDVRTEGDDVFVEVLGEAFWPLTGSRVCEMGSCSTRDKFFSGKDGRSATMGKFIEAAGGDRRLGVQMMVGHVKKKAWSNWVSRVVCAVMGIKGLTWQRLGELGFSSKTAGAQVNFAKGAEKAKAAAKTGKLAEPAGYVPLSELPNLAAGSVVSTTGDCTKVRGAKTKDQKNDLVYATLTDAGVSIDVSKWGTVPDWLVLGARVYVTQMNVRIVGSQRYYNVDGWELAPDEPGQEA